VRGVIVAGPSEDADELGPAARRLAAKLGWPLLADPLSGGRYGPAAGAHVVAAYDLFMKSAAVREALRPDVILRVGTSPTSAALQEWMLHHNGVTHVVIDDSARWKDHGASATHYGLADPTDAFLRLAEHVDGQGSTAWSERWRRADEAARVAVAGLAGHPEGEHGGVDSEAGAGDPTHEGLVVAEVLDALPEGANLFVSSSMPIRDLDGYGLPGERTVRVLANRGASGIDGVVSSAFGVASQSPAPTVCLIGDVAFFHDRNGLLWSRETDASVVFVVIDNDGGGIFHMLPVAEHEPHFTTYFATPHGVGAGHAAAAHGLRHVDAGRHDLTSLVGRALSDGTTSIIVVRTNRTVNQRGHVEAAEAVARSVEATLG
jgi:2-succinyl-5-enolpyruvyl-6-hydroxy-3-cyclohexene-1-carboxylate synthase